MLRRMDLDEVTRRLATIGRGAKADLARELDIDPATVSKILNRKRALKLGEPEIIERWLQQQEQGAGLRPAAALRTSGGVVPVYGYSLENRTAISLTDDRIVRMAPMHPAQEGHPQVGAAEVLGENMLPRYRPRELVYFVFGYRPRSGDDVIVEHKDGSADIYEYVMQKDGHVFLKEYFPEERTLPPIKSTDVKALHTIVGRG